MSLQTRLNKLEKKINVQDVLPWVMVMHVVKTPEEEQAIEKENPDENHFFMRMVSPGNKEIWDNIDARHRGE